MYIQSYTTLPNDTTTLWQEFLSQMELCADEGLDQTVLIWENGQLIATGSRSKNLLKCIAVAPHWQGQGLTATILTQLRQDAFRHGYQHLFIYTKPNNIHLFTPFFFTPVAQTNDVLLMEDGSNGILDFLNRLPRNRSCGTIGAIVMNCDPFTLGHQHLVETAAANCDWVYLFILSEDGGYFSPQHRIEMVKLGTSHLHNVTVYPTGPYLISTATFPTYFLKNRDQVSIIQCQLDIEIFVRYFAPHFGITHRYVGTEPLSPMTDGYNQILSRELPSHGIQLQQVPRLCQNGIPISASAVRTHIEATNWNAIRPLIPSTTLSYIQEVVK